MAEVTITAEELEELRTAKAERDAVTAERDHERQARLSEQRRADTLESRVSVAGHNLHGAQVASLEAQAQQAKTAVEGIDAELDGYERQIADLNADGKFEEASKINRKMSDASARRAQAMQAQTYFTQQTERAKQAPADPVDQFFVHNPGFNEQERTWLKSNPRYATDEDFRNRVNRAHAEFANAGGQPGSTEYFEALAQAGYMRQPPRPQPKVEPKPAPTGEGDPDNPLSSAATETDDGEPGGSKVEPAARPGGAAAPSRRAPATPAASRPGLRRRLTPDEAETALALSEQFPEDVQNGGEAAIFAHYADLKDNHPYAKRLKEEWANR